LRGSDADDGTKRLGAEIFFIDEAGVRSDAALQRTWGAKGETPIVPTSGQRQKVNAISAVNATGAFWYDVYTGKFNARVFIAKLKSYMRNRGRPVFLVLDGHPAHRVKIVPAYLQSLKGRLEVEPLAPKRRHQEATKEERAAQRPCREGPRQNQAQPVPGPCHCLMFAGNPCSGIGPRRAVLR
jgi:hypothetical protein